MAGICFSQTSLIYEKSPPATQATFYGSEKVEKPSRFVMYSRHFKDSALIAV